MRWLRRTAASIGMVVLVLIALVAGALLMIWLQSLVFG